MAETDAGLFDKLAADRLLQTYSIYGLFPGPYQRIYRNRERPQLTFDGRTRGLVAIFRFREPSDNQGLVVKPLQSRREGEIAQLAGAAQVGPTQYPSLAGFITEEFIPGVFFTDLAANRIADGGNGNVGNDRSDSSQSDAGNAGNDNAEYGCRLIDFGVSLRLDNHPRLEPEEVYNFVRTLPEFRLFSGMGLGGPELGRFLEQYRQRLSGVSKEAILNRDLRFVDEGLLLAARRLGDSIQAPFRAGFGEAYG